MQTSTSLPLEPHVKADLGLTASASSSSRLNNVSSSSRRLRHTSSSAHVAQKTGLVANHSPLANAARLTFSRLFYFPSLPAFSDEDHRVVPRVPAPIPWTVVRCILLVWTWFCLLYFSAVVFNALLRTVLGWRHLPPPVEALIDFPERILATLPLDHRLSKLSSLSSLLDTLQPFVLGPRHHEDNPTTACLWTQAADLSQFESWVSSWQGPMSLVVTTPSTPESLSRKQLLSRLTSLSQMAPDVSFHVLYTQTSLHNSNAYTNLARLFSPSSKVLLFPPFSMSAEASLPQTSASLAAGEEFIIPMKPTGLSNSSSADMSHSEFLATSALLLKRDDSPWCTERLFTMVHSGEKQELSALYNEIGFHWQECVWNVWLRSTGRITMLKSNGWAIPEAKEAALLEELPKTAETSLGARVARKQRSETCMLVARELISLGQWYDTETPPPSTEVAGGTATDNGPVSTATTVRGSRGRRPKESSNAKWLRRVCKETLDRWGKEILD